jgi:hypothetical protein
MKKMTNLEKLRVATPEQIADMFCDILCEDFGDCSDVCPRSIFERCATGKNGFEEWLNEEAETQKDASKDAPKDVFKGWVKLKTPKSTIRIDASKIVALGPVLSDAAAGSTGAITKVYTIGAEYNPWLVCENIDEVMGKIEKAKREK